MPRPAIHPGEILAHEPGERGITDGTALRLGHWFATNPRFWLNLQTAYDLRRAEQQSGPEIARLPTRAAAA